MGKLGGWKKAALIWLSILLLIPITAKASTLSSEAKVEFKTWAEIDFPNAIIFHLEANSPYKISKVVLRYEIERKRLFEEITDQYPQFEPGKKIKTSFRWDLTRIGGLPPGARIKYFWMIWDEGGNSWSSPPQILEFIDPLFHWKWGSKDGFTFFWYAGDEKFIDKLFEGAYKAQRELERLLDVKLLGVKFYIYENTRDLLRARVFPMEWEGGVAFPEYGTIVMAVSPANIYWGKKAIAHELTHLAIFEATFGGFSPIPNWLNEGLAVYMEGGLNPEMRAVLESAIKKDRLFSIRSLSSPFPTGIEEALLSYAQSYSIVEFLIKTGGEEKIAALLKLLRDGESYQDGLLEVYEWNITALEKAWRKSLGLPPKTASLPSIAALCLS